MKTALYRHFDSAGVLLYVGISNKVHKRIAEHSRAAKWFPEVARIDIQWFPNLEEALSAERTAIKTEKPKLNKQHSTEYVRPAVNKITIAVSCDFAVVVHAETGRKAGPFDQETAALVCIYAKATFPEQSFFVSEVKEAVDIDPINQLDLRDLRCLGKGDHKAGARACRAAMQGH